MPIGGHIEMGSFQLMPTPGCIAYEKI
jgi:hypothetical protein